MQFLPTPKRVVVFAVIRRSIRHSGSYVMSVVHAQQLAACVGAQLHFTTKG